MSGSGPCLSNEQKTKHPFSLLKAATPPWLRRRSLAKGEIGVALWNRIGWLGTSGDFLYASNQPVARNPSRPETRDTRGVARVLSGQLAGALEDFEALRKGQNPSPAKNSRPCVKSSYGSAPEAHFAPSCRLDFYRSGGLRLLTRRDGRLLRSNYWVLGLGSSKPIPIILLQSSFLPLPRL